MQFNTWILACSAAALAALTGCATGSREAPASTTGFVSELHCGQLPITVTQKGESILLDVNGQQLALSQVISASGAKYQVPGDPETTLWFKGEQASLVVQGVEYPHCAPAGAIIEPFRASGNEPFWSVLLEHGMLSLNRLNEGELPAQSYVVSNGSGQINTQGDHPVSLTVNDQLCHDSMSGMPFPQQVSVQVDGATLTGCGGQPERLLQGAEWVVEDINGGGIIDRSRVTLNFWTDGRVTGRASCNNFMGSYQLTGESLTISQPATTMMACAPSLMEQERRVLDNLQTLQGFDFDETGALLLRTANGSLKARLETR